MRNPIDEGDLAALRRLPEIEPSAELDECVQLRMLEEITVHGGQGVERDGETAGNVPRLEAVVHLVVVAAYCVYAVDFVVRTFSRFLGG
jgi:hypothetical protein